MARKTSFYYSFLVLAPERRRAIGAVWDFCRAVDDSVDEAPSDGRPAAREALCGWRGEIARCFGSGDPQTREGRGLRPFVEPFHLPRAAFEDVIDGVAMDLETTRYETFDDLFEYCRRVASAVGMICIEVFGCQSPRSREYALNLICRWKTSERAAAQSRHWATARSPSRFVASWSSNAGARTSFTGGRWKLVRSRIVLVCWRPRSCEPFISKH